MNSCLFSLLIFLSLLFSLRAEGGHVFNYSRHGVDWEEECETGTEQSPININTRTVVKCDENFNVAVYFNETNITSETENLGTTFKSFGNWSTLVWNWNSTQYSFDCSQFHFHAPSEHTINGDYFDGEIHLVHTLRKLPNITYNLNRTYSVLGIFMSINDTAGDHPFFKEYDPTASGEFTLNMSALEDIWTPGNFYFYEGSLTTPGCNEVVNWFVVDTPIQVSTKQMLKFQNAWAKNISFAGGNGNNREIMPLHGREVMAGTLSNGREKLLSGMTILMLVLSVLTWL